MIGDPSGRSSERNLLDAATIERNVAVDPRSSWSGSWTSRRARPRRVMANNLDWLGKLSLIEYLRDVGKHFTVPVHAGQGLGPAAPRARPVVHRVQLHDPPGLRLRDAVPRARRRDADGRRRPVGQHHGRPRAHPADRAATPTRAPPTGSRTSCCCRRRARSSARARAATRCGWTPSGRRPTRSTSTGCRRTTGTSGRTCAGSPSSRASGSRRSTPRSSPIPSSARRSGSWRSTSRRGSTGTRRPRLRCACPRRCSSASRSAIPSLLAGVAQRDSRPDASRPLATGVAVLLADTGLAPSRGEARRLIQGGAITVNGERIGGPGGGAPGADRRRVVRDPGREAAARGRAPASGLRSAKCATSRRARRRP